MQLLNYLNYYKSYIKTDIIKTIQSLREFFKYLYAEKIVGIDISKKIPYYKEVSQTNIPLTYSSTVIEKLLSSMERSSSLGKRDYAIVLTIARLGIRASDIENLKFEHLNWQKSLITFEQTKTQHTISLPILPDVGNAIIDYLKYSRPESEEPYVFLNANPPFKSLRHDAVSKIVKRALLREGIYISGKRCGAHSLRHSLSLKLLENNITLPIISEVLGHKTSESTRFYLRMDIKSLKQCVLDVPPVSSLFYNQKGGGFYE